MVERGFLSLRREHSQPFFKDAGSAGMQETVTGVGSFGEIVFERVGVLVALSLVYLAGGYSVAECLFEVAQRHSQRLVLLCLGVDVEPVFKMVLVPALVSQSA